MTAPRVYEIEGVDGVGKTTLINDLKDRYGSSQIEFYAFPTDRTILNRKPKYTTIKDIVDYHELFIKDFLAHQYILERAVEKEKLVILDRYVTSFLVYMLYDMMHYTFGPPHEVVQLNKSFNQIFLESTDRDLNLIQGLTNSFFNGKYIKQALNNSIVRMPDRTIFLWHPDPSTDEAKVLQKLYNTRLLRMPPSNAIRVKGQMPDTTQTVIHRLKMLGSLLL